MIMINNYGKPDEDVRIQDIIDLMRQFAKEHWNDHADCNTNADGIDDFALDLQEAWDMTKAHPEEWCNCDKCVCKLEHKNIDYVTLTSALLRIHNIIVEGNHTPDEALTAINTIARCAIERHEMHLNKEAK